MNDVKLLGRFVRKPDLAVSKDSTRCSFVIACKSSYAQKEADFIPCVAWNNTARVIYNNFNKGQSILISSGSWRTKRCQNQDGRFFYFNFCLVKKFEFIGSKADNYRFIEDDSDSLIDIDSAIKSYIHALDFNDEDFDSDFD